MPYPSSAFKPDSADVSPPAPAWTGNPVSFGEALDEWLDQLRQHFDDPAKVELYRRLHGDPLPPEVDVPPHPGPDCKDTSRWWRAWNDAYREAGASADGLDDGPPPRPDPSRARRRRALRRVVRREIEGAIPAIVVAVTEALRGK